MERISRCNSSVSRHSLNIGLALDNDAESESVSEAGDIGDRALHSWRRSHSVSLHSSFDQAPENGEVHASNPVSCGRPLPYIMTPLPTNGKMTGSEDIKQVSSITVLLYLLIFSHKLLFTVFLTNSDF